MIDMNLMDKALNSVVDERHRQDRKFNDPPCWPDSVGIKLAVLTEEVGEVAKAILENGEISNELREELVQVAAVAVKWIESIDAVRAEGRDTRVDEVELRQLREIDQAARAVFDDRSNQDLWNRLEEALFDGTKFKKNI